MIKEAISLLVSGQSLTMEQATEVMEEMTTGQVTPPSLVPLSPA